MKICIVLPRRPWYDVIKHGFLALGILCLGVCIYWYVDGFVYQAYGNWSFDHRSSRHHAPPGDLGGRQAPSASSTIGRISIPRVGWAAMVREGDNDDILRTAVGHIPATAVPGQAGNVGVAGHRDTFFRSLKSVKKHDEIKFSTLDGDYKYEVESMMIVSPHDTAVLAASSRNTLTMVTCYPFQYVGKAPERFVVVARQVGR